MSFAIQCLQESIIGAGGYVSEIDAYEKLKCSQDIIFDAFGELIFKGLLSEEFYENKGHKVLGRFVGHTNEFEIDPEATIDAYDCAFFLEFRQIYENYKGEKHSFKTLDQIFVGSKETAIDHANKLKEILSTDPDFPVVEYTITEKTHST